MKAAIFAVFTAALAGAAIPDADSTLERIKHSLAENRYSEAQFLIVSLAGKVRAEGGHEAPPDVLLKLTASVHSQPPRPIPPLDRALQLIRSENWEGALLELRRAGLVVTQLGLSASRRESYLRLAEEAERSQNPGRLQTAARWALGVGDTDPATRYIDRSLDLLSSSGSRSSSDSLLLHRGHTIKGLVYAADGLIRPAIAELMKSVEYLNQSRQPMRPVMQLADRLLELNEGEAVVTYLEACSRAGWNEPQLSDWISTIRGGGSTTFPESSYLF